MAEEKDIFKIFEKMYPGKRMARDNAFVPHPYSAEHTRSRKFLYPDIKPVDPDSLFASRRYPTERAMEEAFKRKRRRSETRKSERDEKGVVMVDNLNHAEDSTATGAASSRTNTEEKGGSILNNELGLLSLEASGQSSSAPTAFGAKAEAGVPLAQTFKEGSVHKLPTKDLGVSSEEHINHATASGKKDEMGGGFVLNIDSEFSNEEDAADFSSATTGAASFGTKAGDRSSCSNVGEKKI